MMYTSCSTADGRTDRQTDGRVLTGQLTSGQQDTYGHVAVGTCQNAILVVNPGYCTVVTDDGTDGFQATRWLKHFDSFVCAACEDASLCVSYSRQLASMAHVICLHYVEASLRGIHQMYLTCLVPQPQLVV